MDRTSAGATSATLNLATAGNGDKGDAITVRVTANDGTANSTPVTSAAVTILNTVPTATVSAGADHACRPNQTVTATATRADVDDDAVTLTYVWKLNGVVRKTTAATSSLTDTFDLSTIGGDNGDTLSVELTPNDGTANGTMVSATATVDIRPCRGPQTARTSGRNAASARWFAWATVSTSVGTSRR